MVRNRDRLGPESPTGMAGIRSNNHAEYWYGPGGDRAMFRQSARIAGQTVLTL
jgi:hypothetical protein